jgi:hypothetical protein
MMAAVTTAEAKALETAIPDLAAIPLEQIDELGGNVLARSIETYRERLRQGGVPISSFNAGI